jgi:hypothetical protein
MKRNHLLTLVLVLVASLVAGTLLGRFVLESAEAQSLSARDRWEYCAITDVTAVLSGSFSHTTIATAKICYFESGCRKEAIEVSVDGSDFDDAKNVALGRAVTRLGQQGWEMVGEATLRFNSAEDRKVLYFRRTQR